MSPRTAALSAVLLCASCAQPLALNSAVAGLNTLNMAATQAAMPQAAATAASGQSPWLWLGPLVGALATVAGVLIANVFTARNTKAGIIQKTNEIEITSIDERLKTFIGPFQQLSAENLSLAQAMKRKHGDASFRTLTSLLTEGWLSTLSSGDAKLLEVVVGNGIALRQMILDNAGATSSALLPYFAAASTHFRFLYLAREGSLDMDPKRFGEYVYPRQLDEVLDLERQRLEARRELLRSKPDLAHKAMPALVIPERLQLPISGAMQARKGLDATAPE